MKKNYILALAVLAGGITFAQKQATEAVNTWDRLPENFDRSEDTLNPASFSDACIGNGFALYGATGGGYVTGANSYGDVAKGQLFTLNGQATVVGAQVLYGEIDVQGGATMVTAGLYDDSQSLLTAATPHAVSAIDTTSSGDDGLYNYTFTGTAVTNDFYIMVGWALGDDTLGIVSTTDPCGNGSYEIWSDASWNDIETAWNGLMIDMVITALVDDLEYTGIFDIEAPEFGIYQSNDQLVLNSISEDVIMNSVSIYDMNGKIVKTFPTPDQFDNFSFDISDVNAGNYIITINSSMGNLSQKMNLK
jgi:hypothetical protein